MRHKKRSFLLAACTLHTMFFQGTTKRWAVEFGCNKPSRVTYLCVNGITAVSVCEAYSTLWHITNCCSHRKCITQFQCNTLCHSTAQHSTAQHSAAPRNIALCKAPVHSTIQPASLQGQFTMITAGQLVLVSTVGGWCMTISLLIAMQRWQDDILKPKPWLLEQCLSSIS